MKHFVSYSETLRPIGSNLVGNELKLSEEMAFHFGPLFWKNIICMFNWNENK